jgi:hypothetical protein
VDEHLWPMMTFLDDEPSLLLVYLFLVMELPDKWSDLFFFGSVLCFSLVNLEPAMGANDVLLMSKAYCWNH